MPSIDIRFLQKLKTDLKEYPVFIESGTFYGETTFSMEPHFRSVHTIEIKPEFHNSVKSRYRGNKVHFHLGDSVSVLENLLPTVNDNALFFLDGHWSAGDTGRGVKDCPLIEELDVIMKSFKGRAVIIVDDRRLFGKGPRFNNEVCNWEDISDKAILDTVRARLDTCYYLESNLDPNDRMIIHLNPLE